MSGSVGPGSRSQVTTMGTGDVAISVFSQLSRGWPTPYSEMSSCLRLDCGLLYWDRTRGRLQYP
eukprot:3940583-Rhodomonas_salina.8